MSESLGLTSNDWWVLVTTIIVVIGCSVGLYFLTLASTEITATPTPVPVDPSGTDGGDINPTNGFSKKSINLGSIIMRDNRVGKQFLVALTGDILKLSVSNPQTGVTGVDWHLSIDNGATFPFAIGTNIAGNGTFEYNVTDTYLSDTCIVRASPHGSTDTNAYIYTRTFGIRPKFDFAPTSSAGSSTGQIYTVGVPVHFRLSVPENLLDNLSTIKVFTAETKDTIPGTETTAYTEDIINQTITWTPNDEDVGTHFLTIQFDLGGSYGDAKKYNLVSQYFTVSDHAVRLARPIAEIGGQFRSYQEEFPSESEIYIIVSDSVAPTVTPTFSYSTEGKTEKTDISPADISLFQAYSSRTGESVYVWVTPKVAQDTRASLFVSGVSGSVPFDVVIDPTLRFVDERDKDGSDIVVFVSYDELKTMSPPRTDLAFTTTTEVYLENTTFAEWDTWQVQIGTLTPMDISSDNVIHTESSNMVALSFQVWSSDLVDDLRERRITVRAGKKNSSSADGAPQYSKFISVTSTYPREFRKWLQIHTGPLEFVNSQRTQPGFNVIPAKNRQFSGVLNFPDFNSILNDGISLGPENDALKQCYYHKDHDGNMYICLWSSPEDFINGKHNTLKMVLGPDEDNKLTSTDKVRNFFPAVLNTVDYEYHSGGTKRPISSNPNQATQLSIGSAQRVVVNYLVENPFPTNPDSDSITTRLYLVSPHDDWAPEGTSMLYLKDGNTAGDHPGYLRLDENVPLPFT